ncbi:secondary thiamine-phosphate synthase enzyme YjbQ [Vallitaleaceae bacterium 9-2]
MTKQFSIKTEREQFYDITKQVQEVVSNSNVLEGLCTIYCPHTTAGITINENADPDVITDMLFGLDKAFPDRKEFRHREGNSSAHLKSSCVGASETLLIHHGEIILGTWQSVYFCEFDGPRHREYYIHIHE